MNADHQQMQLVTEGLQTKSEKIRRLAGAGYARADIARFLDIRYQHVRKVLVDEEARQAKAAGSTQPAASDTAGGEEHPTAKVGPRARRRPGGAEALRQGRGVQEGPGRVERVLAG